jgi:dTDP-4-amino-4,6-dideoxygalactose transaminase
MTGPGVPFYDLAPVHGAMADELRSAFERVLANGRFVGGSEVERFEQMLAGHVGTAHAVGVGSGTAALHLALVAAGIGAGDEVILPPSTYFATAEAVVAAGARPVFADVDPSTALIDPDAVEAAITPFTAAVIAVHLYGQPADMHALGKLARRYGLFLLEDAAQAIGAAWDGAMAGSIGGAGAFSFYPSKNVGALGDGGAVTTSDAALAVRVRRLSQHGESAKNIHVEFGRNERLDALQAAFLSVKLARLEEAQAQRLRAVDRYDRALRELPDVTALRTAAPARHAHHLAVVRVSRRDTVLDMLRARGVDAMVHYPTPVHLQPAFAPFGSRPGQFPESERLASEVLSLPLFAGITDVQVDRCVAALAECLGRSR